MPYTHITQDILNVPGRMAADELAFLAALAAMVPPGGRIVEVGPFYGRSTNAMARANPSTRITSIDTFQDVEWTKRFAARQKDIPKFSQDAFRYFTGHLPNVDAIQGFSPDSVADWSEPVDMYFEDAIHGNPGLKANLDFWISRLRPGGIACGHDYTLRFPDIKAEVDRRARDWGQQVSVVGSLWALRRPATDGQRSPQPDGLFPNLSDLPSITVRGANKKNGLSAVEGGYWCGAHLEADRLNWISIDDISGTTGIRLEYRLGHPDFGETSWIQAGQKARLDVGNVPRPFTRLAVRRADNRDQTLPNVIYRVSARQIGNGGFGVSGTSQWASNGAWAALKHQGPAVNAITVALLDSDLEAQQAQQVSSRGSLLRSLRTLGSRNIPVSWQKVLSPFT